MDSKKKRKTKRASQPSREQIVILKTKREKSKDVAGPEREN